MSDPNKTGKKDLPQRTTRGKRLRAQLEEEDEADAEFWNQEFFAEDARDDDYISEKEEEDVPDSDFFESESEEDEGEVEVRKEPKKKALKAPGAPPTRPRPPKPAAHKPPKPPSSPSAAAAAELSQALILEATYEAPTLRKSTQKRVEEAKRERQQRDQQAKLAARPKKQGDAYVMTQEELLAEAARTELENLASLKVLVAQEEETKRKANVKKQRFGGPLVKVRSRAVEVLAPVPNSTSSHHHQQQPVSQLDGMQCSGAVPAQGDAPAAAAAGVVPAVASLPVGTAAMVSAGSSSLATAAEPGVNAQAAGSAAAAEVPQAAEQQNPAAGPAVVKQEVTTLQCCGMKAPKWLQPQRAHAPPGKPLCAITGVVAKYRDPATGYHYASAAALRELRRRLGQPVPECKPRSVRIGELQAATSASGTVSTAGVTATSGYPCGYEQLQELLSQHVQQQQTATAASRSVKGHAGNSMCYQQPAVPDEVAALIVGISAGY